MKKSLSVIIGIVNLLHHNTVIWGSGEEREFPSAELLKADICSKQGFLAGDYTILTLQLLK